MLYLNLLLVFIFASCAQLKKDNSPQESKNSDNENLIRKKSLYCSLSEDSYRTKLYVHSKCDGLLFTSLHGLACDYVDIGQFQKEPGVWKRSPSKDCFAMGESKTGISRDMLTGLIFLAWNRGNLEILEDLIEYGENNNWDMCDGEYLSEKWRLGRCIMSPTLKATLYEVATKLGYECGSRCKLARSVPQVWDPHETGFRAHLLQLQILLRGLVQGGINDNQLEQLNWQRERAPDNALFQATHALYTDGDFSHAIRILLDTNHFPEQSLPTTAQHCSSYLWERDPGSDYQPCEPLKYHDGTDFLLVSAIILGELRGQHDFGDD